MLKKIIACIFMFVFLWVVLSNTKKSPKVKEEEKEQVKNDTKDMDFWEACQYTANEKKKRSFVNSYTKRRYIYCCKQISTFLRNASDKCITKVHKRNF